MSASEDTPTRSNFDFYGLRVQIESGSDELVNHVERDFAFFRADRSDECDLFIEGSLDQPSYHLMPDLEASMISPRNVVYRDGKDSYVDYFGKGLLLERGTQVFISSPSPDFLREIFYLFILSKVGLHLDRIALHRLHAAALTYKKRSVLLLCPSGGGKSTTTFHLLRKPDYQMLSEDSPLIDRNGWIHPFPLCLGCKGEPPEEIPEHNLRRISRMEFDPKTLIDLEYFGDSITREKAPPGIAFVGVRHSGIDCRIEPISRFDFFRILVRDMIVGMGLYQGVEFLFQNQLSGLIRHAVLVASRTRNALALAKSSQPYLLRMGRDIEHNIETLDAFLQSQVS